MFVMQGAIEVTDIQKEEMKTMNATCDRCGAYITLPYHEHKGPVICRNCYVEVLMKQRLQNYDIPRR
jgi:formylmethanofuran dehydrogenase subunit E